MDANKSPLNNSNSSGRSSGEKLTVHHKRECEVLMKTKLLDSGEDSIDPCILLCNISNHQRKAIYMVT